MQKRNSKGQFVRASMKERVLKVIAKKGGQAARADIVKATGLTPYQVSRTLWQLGDQVQQVQRGTWAV